MSKIHIVPTNNWMANIVKASPLLYRFETTVIPNGIDPKVFRPIAKSSAREVLAIPQGSKVILFCAHEASTGTRKGGEFVIPILENLSAETNNKIKLIVLGERSESWQEGNGYQTMRLGFTKSDEMLAIVYSAADLLISPALAENFPNTILESFACGTPAVAFDTGGVSDIVHHLQTGYLSKYKDVRDMATGIKNLVNDRELLYNISTNCRELVVKNFSSQLQTNRFIELYQNLSMN